MRALFALQACTGLAATQLMLALGTAQLEDMGLAATHPLPALGPVLQESTLLVAPAHALLVQLESLGLAAARPLPALGLVLLESTLLVAPVCARLAQQVYMGLAAARPLPALGPVLLEIILIVALVCARLVMLENTLQVAPVCAHLAQQVYMVARPLYLLQRALVSVLQGKSHIEVLCEGALLHSHSPPCYLCFSLCADSFVL